MRLIAWAIGLALTFPRFVLGIVLGAAEGVAIIAFLFALIVILAILTGQF